MADLKNIMQEVKTVAKTPDIHKDGMSRKRAIPTGFVIGLIGGAMIGQFKGWSLFWSGFTGASIGALSAALFTPVD